MALNDIFYLKKKHVFFLFGFFILYVYLNDTFSDKNYQVKVNN